MPRRIPSHIRKEKQNFRLLISYGITSLLILFASVVLGPLGIFHYKFSIITSVTESVGLNQVVQIFILLTANFILHALFYHGGSNRSPFIKGVGIGFTVGFVLFTLGLFACTWLDINSSSVHLIGSTLIKRTLEFTTCGFATAVLSVFDLPRWGILRAF